MRSSAWASTALLWTYDDWGGFYDHVPPPQVDRSGYGFRAPALLVSPYAKRGYVDHTTLDVTSVLKFIEQNWGLRPLASRDRGAQSITGAFDFAQPPRKAAFIGLDRGRPPVTRARTWVVYACYLGALAAAGFLITITVATGRRRPGDRGTAAIAPEEAGG
jgi:phospholipase C